MSTELVQLSSFYAEPGFVLLARAGAEPAGCVALNTLPTMTQAIGLYRDLGFTPVDPYVADPTDGVLYFNLDL